MRILFWRVEWAGLASSTTSAKTRIRIELMRTPEIYTYKWAVAEKLPKRLSRREIHQLDMRVAKYVGNMMSSQKPPQETKRSIHFADL